MKNLKDFKGRTFNWVRPKILKRHYEMRSGGDLYATLTWEKAFGSLAVGKCADAEYSFKRGGFLHPFVAVKKRPFNTDLAKLQMDMGGNGVLQFVDGRTYRFEKLSFWKLHWGFTDSGGKLQCTAKDKPLSTKECGEESLEPGARMSPHLPVLLLLAWYVITLRREESSAVGVAASSGAG